MAGALLLVVTWVSAVLAARAALRMVGVRAAAVTGVFAAGLLAVVPGQLARATADLRVGMAIAATLFAVVAFLGSRRARDVEEAAVGAPNPAWPAWPAWIVGALGLACVVQGALTRNFFDEEHHVPMATVIARGVVPPEHPLVPGQVIPYHWGVDALYAQLIVGGLRPDHSIDVVTILSWALMLAAAAFAGAVLAGRAGATLLVILAPLAGSPLAQPLHDGMGLLEVKNPGYPPSWSEWTRRPPPLTADFFQHPQGIAFPLVLVVLALFCGADAGRGRRGAAASLLAMLSLVQAVHFLVLGFGLVVSTWVMAIAARDRRDVRRAAEDSALLAGALVLAVIFGGFFSPGAGTSASLVWGASFFSDPSLAGTVAHHLAIFGLPLLLLPLALWPFEGSSFAERPSRRMELALFAGAVVGFALPNVVVYKSSWDIVKLYSAGGFLAGVALAATFARATAMARGPARALVPVVVAVLTLATIEFPLAWMASRTVLQGRFDVPVKRDWRLRDDVLAAGRAVTSIIPGRARVLVNDAELGRMNGLLAPGFDARRFASGHILDFERTRQAMNLRVSAIKTLHPVALESLDVEWVLLSTRDEAALTPGGKEELARLERVPVEGLKGYALWRIPGRR